MLASAIPLTYGQLNGHWNNEEYNTGITCTKVRSSLLQVSACT